MRTTQRIARATYTYIIRVPLRASHEILIDATSDFEAADEHLPALAVVTVLLFQRDGDLFKNTSK